jgi:hypothetical protein
VVEHVDDETANIVANPTVDSRVWVTTICRFADARARGIMTLAALMAHYIGTSVIRETADKGIRGVTVTAITGGIGMVRHSLFASGDYAVVAACTTGRNTGMVKGAVCL